jgi:predicted porin
LDSSIGYATGLLQNTNAVVTTVTSATAAQTTGTSLNFIDGSFATSAWGMRGSEDLGGGRAAKFHMESDLMTNSGGSHTDGLFRRAANVSLSDKSLGEVFLGRRGNAYIIATGTMLPVQGNTVHQWRTVIGSSIGDQVSNSVSYATPTIMKTDVLVQYGLNNAVDGGDDGTTFGANLFNRSVQNLTIAAAYNVAKRTGTGAQLSSATAAGSATTGASKNVEGYAVGLKYKVTPAIEVGTFYAHGRTHTGTNASPVATSFMTTAATGVGVGYQVSSNLLLGANYVRTTFDAGMANLQAHYMLSKRTRVYSQATMNTAASGNRQSGNFAAGNFSPIHCNSSKTTATQAVCADGMSSSGGSNVPANNAGYVVGIIHSF